MNTFVQNSLKLILLPTEKCNFRCTYCYEDFMLGRMPRPVIDGVKNLIARRIGSGTLSHLELDWFGGEPLVARNVLFEISKYANEFYERGILKTFKGSLTTNAYFLSLETLQELVALRQQNFQISLDGYGEDHDKTRKQADGSGSFDVVWNNLLAATKWKEGNFEIVLRLHITEQSYRNMPKLCSEIATAFAGDSRFMVFFKRITNLGGPNKAGITQVPLDMASAAVAEAVQHLEAAGVRYSNGVNSKFESQVPVSTINIRRVGETPLSGKVVSAPYICYASKPNSFVIRSNGRLAKCTVAFSDPKNDIGHIDANGGMHIASEKVAFWTRGLLTGDHATLGCPADG
ncbi:radical SAM protein [Xanthomonas nasturtii]|uniref:radical SAM protein n=1 Tax=Xanthomonas TaxID=338 RepID=UPI000E1E8E82|nr:MULTISPECIES: radical SAM protein [Xanthomonas]MEA9558518.1 radical SAM protein [Xanthomonas nasturtii]